MNYYIISLCNTKKSDKFLTLWRPDNKGYCYSKGMAGVYEEIQEDYHNSPYNMAIPADKANDLFMTVDYEGEKRSMIPNCKAVWDQIGVKMVKELKRI